MILLNINISNQNLVFISNHFFFYATSIILSNISLLFFIYKLLIKLRHNKSVLPHFIKFDQNNQDKPNS